MIRDLEYPADAQRVIDSLHAGLRYDAAVAVLGVAASTLPLAPDRPDFTVAVRCGGRAEDEAVRRDAAGLLSRYALISMVSRVECHAQHLLLQRRVLEHLGGPHKRMDSASMWNILRQVHADARRVGPRRLCTELVVTTPSSALAARMDWFEGLVRVRNCLAHRLGHVQMEDVKPPGTKLEDTKDNDRLTATWLRTRTTLDGKQIELPHVGGGNLNVAFESYRREWKVGEQIHISPLECQGICMSLSLLGNQLLADFIAEMNGRLKTA